MINLLFEFLMNVSENSFIKLHLPNGKLRYTAKPKLLLEILKNTNKELLTYAIDIKTSGFENIGIKGIKEEKLWTYDVYLKNKGE